MKITGERMVKEKYSFQNIYCITTYRCNHRCDFCLFRFNKEKECDIKKYLLNLEYCIKESKDRIYIKITGGEPFIYPTLLKEIFLLANKYKDKIYRIGVGTNGSIIFPDFLNDVNIKTHIYVSRHNMDDLSIGWLTRDINNPNIDYRFNCNLIKGGVDNIDKINKYIHLAYINKVKFITFRELNNIYLDNNENYDSNILDYKKYYINNKVSIKDIKLPNNFKLSKVDGNPYDTNYWYWYKSPDLPKKTSVKFRVIDEKKLTVYNKIFKGVDEYTIHPSGRVTGCWDKDTKIIKKGG